MKVTVLAYDENTQIAFLRFEHNGVTLEDRYDLGLVIPGTRRVFADLGMEFDRGKQQAAMII